MPWVREPPNPPRPEGSPEIFGAGARRTVLALAALQAAGLWGGLGTQGIGLPVDALGWGLATLWAARQTAAEIANCLRPSGTLGNRGAAPLYLALKRQALCLCPFGAVKTGQGAGPSASRVRCRR